MNEYEMQQYVMEEAMLNNVSKGKVILVWRKAYYLHKLEHGSFKYIKEPEYSRKMFERAMFCADNCLEYIIYKSKNGTDKNQHQRC